MSDPESGPPTASIELIQRAQQGDRTALDALLDRYRERLLQRIRLMMGDPARRVAESGDFLQAMFVDVAEGLERFEVRDEQAFLRWATQIARNRIRDRVRKKREKAFESFSQSGLFGNAVPAEQRSPLSAAGFNEDSHRLLEALEQLSDEYRRVIELRDFEGMPHREIAERMGKPSEAAAQMLHARAIARLTTILT